MVANSILVVSRRSQEVMSTSLIDILKFLHYLAAYRLPTDIDPVSCAKLCLYHVLEVVQLPQKRNLERHGIQYMVLTHVEHPLVDCAIFKDDSKGNSNVCLVSKEIALVTSMIADHQVLWPNFNTLNATHWFTSCSVRAKPEPKI